ncbi:MAG: hypothetical protein QN178_10785 [Armatimonadota bacterium]|nr:hypothetical protein [Armatimonadota bacterium]
MRLRFLMGLLATVMCGSLAGAPAGAAPGVPAEYADLYAVLERQLRSIDRHVLSHGQVAPHSGLFSTELLPANANIGERLLRPEAWQAVTLNLDRFELLGVRAVKVAVKYPVLVPGFPRSAEYLEFYRRLGQELRRRNIKMLAQMTNGFREPAFSQLPVESYYAGLTWDRFKREKRQQAEAIIREVRPDFLTVENEPGTQQANTGLTFTPRSMAELVQFVLDGLDRQTTLVGAGAGTWDDPAYMQALARTPVDYLDMHVYPITRDFVVDRAFRIADVARRANKKLFLGEAWLYKAADRDLGGAPVAAAPALFARDVYGFWEPLDVEFLQVMARLSRALRIEFTNYFWSRYFFGYVEYGAATRGLPPAELFRLANRAAAANMTATPPRVTRTGEAFQRLNRGTF